MDIELPGSDAVAAPQPDTRSAGKLDTDDHDTLHLQRRNTRTQLIRNSNMKYLEEKNVGLFLNVMLTELFHEKPDNPMAWCTQFFLRHDEISEASKDRWVHKGDTLQLTDEMRIWSAQWRLPYVIDELLAAIMESQPEEPDSFAGSWFRWNHKAFPSEKHALPEGWTPSKQCDA
eukprot:Rhum_TRINITY_DN11934_c1_g1::Rhum_TRINITY_DN11934_c1_g1_i1::g.47726::m.47726